MVASDAPARVALSPDDVAGGLALSVAAGWNQAADDWRFFLAHADTFGCRDEDGTLVATACALRYLPGRAGTLGWISMVLVAPAFRGQGLATGLLHDCVRVLLARHAVPVLDATPAGAEVYRRLGFHAGFTLARWHGEGGAAASQDGIRAATAQDRAACLALDAQASGADRSALIGDLLGREGAWALVIDGGFVIARPGTRATQIGPLVAPDEASAVRLLQAALAQVPGRVFLDLPDRWSGLAAALTARGFVRQRPFTRMALGSVDIAAPHDTQFVLAGPEFG